MLVCIQKKYLYTASFLGKIFCLSILNSSETEKFPVLEEGGEIVTAKADALQK